MISIIPSSQINRRKLKKRYAGTSVSMKSFWKLGGSLYSGIVLTDEELRTARDAFEKEWPRRM